jgi:hypothetical protein
VSLVLDLRIVHERFGSHSDSSIDGHLHYPDDLDRSLNEDVSDKIRQYHVDYDNRPSNDISFMTVIVSTSGCLHREFVCLVFLQTHRETHLFFADSGVQVSKTNRDQFQYRHVDFVTAFSSQIKTKVGNILVKTEALRINLNIDGVPIVSKSHTHPFITPTLIYRSSPQVSSRFITS